MYNSITQGWFSFTGIRGRWNWIGASILSALIFSILAVPLFLLSFGVAIIPIILLYFWVMCSMLTQRIRHCGAQDTTLILLVILCVIFPIAQLVFLFWPGKETTVNPIKKASKSGNFSIRKEPTLFKS